MPELVKTALFRARSRRGLTQPAFAKKLGEVLGRTIRADTLNRWEKGRHMPGADVLVAAAVASQISIETLLTGEESLQARFDRLEAEVNKWRPENGAATDT